MRIDGNSTIHIKVGMILSLFGMPSFIGTDINSNEELCEVQYVIENLSEYLKVDIKYDWVLCESIIVE